MKKNGANFSSERLHGGRLTYLWRSATFVRLLTLVGCAFPGLVRADCIGFFNQYEQGYKLEGGRLEPSGERIAPGVQLEFNGIAQVGDRYFLTRSRDATIYDAQNVELTSGCDLPNRPAPQAR